jgi:peptide-methionine (R)-S-oxide reductase
MNNLMTRRYLLGGLGVGTFAAYFMLQGLPMTHADTADFPFHLTEAEWKKKLIPEAYNVLRGHGTEAAGTSPLNHENRTGVFNCAGCAWPLFSSSHKYNSGTGWPSFFQPINDQAVGTSTDYKIVVPRTEVHCANCGGHLGHVFDDGPPPTGKRFCMNGVALKFMPNPV